ncbi:MAG: DUF3592 domain-containing protein [Bacteroidales bacterium]|nr:DUF3592 domain-containing protein [Bacteroidales bacterium]
MIPVIFSILLFISDQCFFKYLNYKQGIGISIIIALTGFFIDLGLRCIEFYKSKSWPVAEGIVQSSKIKPRGDTCYAEIIYKYSVNSIEYESDNINIFLNSISNRSKAESDIIKYSYNKKVKVNFNPQNPSISYLERDSIKILLLWVSSGIAAILIGILLLFGIF